MTELMSLFLTMVLLKTNLVNQFKSNPYFIDIGSSELSFVFELAQEGPKIVGIGEIDDT